MQCISKMCFFSCKQSTAVSIKPICTCHAQGMPGSVGGWYQMIGNVLLLPYILQLITNFFNLLGSPVGVRMRDEFALGRALLYTKLT